MDVFDWNQLFDQVPAEWRATEGKGVKIALLDSGINYAHPALDHLTQAGHKFWITRPGGPLPDGNDDVTDDTGHGTGMASILVGKPEENEGGVKGVAPGAELFMLKIRKPGIGYLAEDMLKALSKAADLKVDIIVSGIIPGAAQHLSQGALQAVTQALETKKILLFTALENTSQFSRMNELRFPCDQASSIVGGAVTDVLSTLELPDSVFDSRIAFLHTAAKVSYAKAPIGYVSPPAPSTCSTAMAALAGVAALAVAHWKAEEGDHYRRRSRTEVLDALKTCFPAYDAAAVVAATQPQFFHLLGPQA